MVDRPILFSAPMVRALLAGTKTQTRRIVKYSGPRERIERDPGNPGLWRGREIGLVSEPFACPYGVPGDVLWVRETFRLDRTYDEFPPSTIAPEAAVWWEADGASVGAGVRGKTRVSIHMPRWAARISLRITDVRVERLNEISEADVIAEGAFLMENGFWNTSDGGPSGHDAVTAYRNLWNHITGPGSWDVNPWVWCISFERVTA